MRCGTMPAPWISPVARSSRRTYGASSRKKGHRTRGHQGYRRPHRAAAAAAVETPVYRREQGLWPHQKYFAHLALERHRLGGARLVLADQVGLGKTVQLAMAALLMALDDPDGGPILVLAPKPLLQQWQDELMELLLLPSARWNGRAWVDENDLEYPSEGAKSLGKCPRRIGLVSQGLVVRGLSEAINQLLSRRYTCVIVDEAHRARRRKVPKVDAGADEIDERADPNKLMAFLRQIGPKTKSMLLATATPVQLHPVEAWDLLHILSHGNEGVLGGWTHTSPWFRPSHCLAIAIGDAAVPTRDVRDGWQYVRDPLPSRFEDPHSTAFAGASMPATRAGNSTPRAWKSCRSRSAASSFRTGCSRTTARISIPCCDASCAEPVPTSKRRSIRPRVPISCPRSR
jgi:hypothetical protein